MFYINNTKYNLFFIVLVTLFLLMDLGQFFLIGTTVIPFLLCVYYVLLCGNARYTLLALIAFLQGLEFFCCYNFFSLACLYLIPTTALAFFFKKNLYPSSAHIITLALTSAIIKIYVIEGYFLHIWPTNYYTIMRISATLFITICFSLTINIWGMQDNRA
ncbi:MAG TPA: hypothetical protein VKR54_02370 [Candidatus Babeliales bacterium]|jgi:hypothetical protein|nr:hypothetical protein [Candidatus Babeliales bacterium]